MNVDVPDIIGGHWKFSVSLLTPYVDIRPSSRCQNKCFPTCGEKQHFTIKEHIGLPDAKWNIRNINITLLKDPVGNSARWGCSSVMVTLPVFKGYYTSHFEAARIVTLKEKRAQRKATSNLPPTDGDHICNICNLINPG